MKRYIAYDFNTTVVRRLPPLEDSIILGHKMDKDFELIYQQERYKFDHVDNSKLIEVNIQIVIFFHFLWEQWGK